MSQPVVIDLETRSACDLKSEGPYRYAAHKTTRVLTAAWTEHGSGVMHCWFPGLVSIPADMQALHLPGVLCYYGPNVPDALTSLTNRIWVGHNAYGFDALVWRALYPDCQPVDWADSMCMASACGMPGGLDRIGQWLWGEGKYEAGKKEAKKAFTATSLDDCDAKHVPLLRQVMTGKYNVQDVKITDTLWSQLQVEYVQPPAEAALFAAHRAINGRGVRVDFGLLQALHHLAVEAKTHAIADIVKLTDGALAGEKAVQSRAQMLAWLTKMGVWEGTSLRRELVSTWIDEHEDVDSSEEVENCKDIQLVVKVLKLRLAALRITGGKLDAAANRMSDDCRIRGLFGLNKAHTGRFTSTGVQLHNLPRPKPGIDSLKNAVGDKVGVWRLVQLYEDTGKLDYEAVCGLLPLNDPKYPNLSPDDAASALLKSLFLPDEGRVLAAADLSQIEARMLAYLAGEKWLMDAFWNDDDPYLRMAVRIMGPTETWPDYNCPLNKHPYRQIVGKIPELAAGYQMGPRKLEAYCAGMGYDLKDYGTTPEKCILEYRRGHSAIAGEEREWEGHTYFRDGFWDALNTAAIRAVETGKRQPVGRLAFQLAHGNLYMYLPSGRPMVYRAVKLVEVIRFERPIIQVEFLHPRYGRKRMYPGAWAENGVQAASRDVMTHGIVANETAGFPICIHVHDEEASSIFADSFGDFMSCVTTPAEWLPDFPLVAEGGCGPRYAKAAYPGWNNGKEVTYRNGKRHK